MKSVAFRIAQSFAAIAVALLCFSKTSNGEPSVKRTAVVSCPGPVASIEVEGQAGKYHPPALLAPSSDNGKSGSNLRSEWTDLAGQNVALHCHPKAAPTSVIDVMVPAEADTCLRAHDKVTCFRK